MRYIDITKTISNRMKVYATDPVVKIKSFKSLKRGNSCNLFELSLGTHAGTHIDAPRHIINKAGTVDNIDLSSLMCDVVVADIDRMRRKDFYNIAKEKNIEGILLKNVGKKTALNLNDARIFTKNRFKIIGTEEASIEDPKDKKHSVHRILLSRGVVIIENLDLGKVKQGFYKLICLPLKIKNGDGAPVRAVLIDD